MRARAVVLSALFAIAASAFAVIVQPASADPLGSVEVTVDGADSQPANGVCLELITPDKKNTQDDVRYSSPPSDLDGHIFIGEVDDGTYIGKYTDCGGYTPRFADFYTGTTYSKAKATPLSVEGSGTTDLGVQLLPNSGVGDVDGTVVDSTTSVEAVGVPIEAFSANKDLLLQTTCTDNTGFYAFIDLPDDTGGVKLLFGGSTYPCSNEGVYASAWLGGSSFKTATTLAVPTDGDDTAPTMVVTPVAKSSVTISSVTFSGTSADPTITISGTGFKKTPKPSPTGRPCGEVDDPSTGFDYGSNLTLWDNTAGWQAGFPGDCIGLVIVSYSSTQIVVDLGSFYSDPQYQQVANGDHFSVRVRGTAFTGVVSGVS